MLWFFIALLPPFFWAVSNLADQYVVRQHFNASMLGFFTLANLAVLPLAFVYPFIFHVPSMTVKEILLTASPSLLIEIALIPYMYAVKDYPAEDTVPVFQTIPALTLLLGWLFLNQRVDTMAAFGILSVVLGALLFSMQGRLARLVRAPKGTLLILTSALGYTVYFLFASHISKEIAPEKISYGLILGWSFLGVLLFAALPQTRAEVVSTLKHSKGRVYALSMLQSWTDVVANIFSVKAISIAPAAAYVMAVNGIQPAIVLFGSYICARMFADKFEFNDTRRDVFIRLAFLPLIVAGLYLVAG